jgi:lipopolysaccharide export system protein LptC
MATDRYSRLITWLKVLLPLLALALLSTLFLISRSIKPGEVMPFADKEVQDRMRSQQVTGPFFSGTTASGDQISFSAETVTTPVGAVGSNQADRIRAQLDLAAGTAITLQAKTAKVDIAADRADLTGNVIITTSDGYRLSSDLLTSTMSSLGLRSPGPVDGVAPAGTLKAGSMELSTPPDGSAPQLVFTNGVKLVYVPKQTEE